MGKAKRERAREKRDFQAERERQAAEESQRRRRLLTFIGLPVAVAVVVGIVLISTLSGGSSSKSGDGTSTAGLKEIAGTQQHGLTLGEESAPVTIHEFADLQCPICKRFSDTVLPKLIPDVKAGKVKIVYEPFAILGPDSETAADALLTTVDQNRAWKFIETFYANQQEENTGYVTDAFLAKIARTAGANVAHMKSELDSDDDALEQQRKAVTSRAKGYGYQSTPTIRIEGPGGSKTMGDAFDVGAIESAISDLAKK